MSLFAHRKGRGRRGGWRAPRIPRTLGERAGNVLWWFVIGATAIVSVGYIVRVARVG